MRFYIFIFIFVIGVALLFFDFKSEESLPVNLNKTHSCASDGMIILNYNGPKAQILWKDGTRSFYCEVKEAFYDFLDISKNRMIKGFFVQDFSYLEWGSYFDKWILAKDAFYVIDSSKNGAMGITYVPFSKDDAAIKFFLENGGVIVKFSDIDFNVLSHSSSLLKDRLIY
jgi:copper chaperone NosL